MSGPGSNTPYIAVFNPMWLTTEVRLTLLKNPGRKILLMARPVWSGPSENKNVARTLCLSSSASSAGTPSCVPR